MTPSFFKKGILFFDVDGTLVDSAHGKASCDDDVKQALGKAQDDGWYTMIVSGRNLSGLSNCMDLNMDGYVFSDGGGVLLEGKDMILHVIPFPIIQNLIHDVTETYQGSIMLSSAYESYGSSGQLEMMEEIAIEKHGVKKEDVHTWLESNHFHPLSLWQKEEIIEIDVCFDTPEHMHEWERHKPSEIDFVETNTSFGKDGIAAGEITLHGVNKGSGIKESADIFHVNISDTWTFGDSMNDLSAFKKAGHSIAMGNGDEALKKTADYVTDSIDQQGLIHALKHFQII